MPKEAVLYEKIDGQKVHCFLCAHNCRIDNGQFGICGVRKNEGGRLYTHVYGNVIASHVDPIEKKPLYHFLPGSRSYSIATIGCNFKCGFCQNWEISQVSIRSGDTQGYELKPEEVVREARRSACKSISYTYTEPTVFFEYAYDTAKLAKREGIYNNFVTNGFMTVEALDKIRPYLDAANVDLKSFRDEFYRKNCGGRLEPVTTAIKHMKKLGLWIEITTLLIPGENDSPEELRGLAHFLAEVGNEIPWHISRFHPDYQFTGHEITPVESLMAARDIGVKAGLKYVYLGNVDEGGDTHCPSCKELVVKRGMLHTEAVRINNGRCPACNTPLEGVWS
ncbi:MAG: AmmeMemoRadiSam system radical SAM enzyme [Candidatus Omnitrophica bacterium]|nr:AmmeMemoRadiSam system radical SAM enzyme [Candidatus Omnitrophota bacterium]